MITLALISLAALIYWHASKLKRNGELSRSQNEIVILLLVALLFGVIVSVGE